MCRGFFGIASRNNSTQRNLRILRLCARKKCHELIVHDVCTLYFHDQLQYPQKPVQVLFFIQKKHPLAPKTTGCI